MEITEIRVKFANREGDRLKAYCSVTFDAEFVVRDVRIVEGANGLFVAMPSRKVSAACPRCNHKNPALAKFCSDCGAKLPAQAPPAESGTRTKLHRDIAHPITPAFRQMLHQRIIEAYEAECEQAKAPNYEPKSLHDDDADILEEPMAEGREVDEPAEEVNEYNALIADLRGRGTDSPNRRDGGRPPVSKKPATAPAEAGRTSSASTRPRSSAPPARPNVAVRGNAETAGGGPTHGNQRPPAKRPPGRVAPAVSERSLNRSENEPLEDVRTPAPREADGTPRGPMPKPAPQPAQSRPAAGRPVPQPARPGPAPSSQPSTRVPQDDSVESMPFGAGV